MSTTSVGAWSHYSAASSPSPYGCDTTYRRAADFLRPVGESIEDWGCGTGYLKTLLPCRGVDGSWSLFCDEVVDLATYRSDADGICIRHVLEHNLDWRAILDNAVASFRKRMVLILYTPLIEKTDESRLVKTAAGVTVPENLFSLEDITGRLGAVHFWTELNIPTNTLYGVEHVFYLEKR